MKLWLETLLRRHQFALAFAAAVVPTPPIIAALGDVDPGFNPSMNGSVSVIATQDDGKILVSGSFTEVDGVPRNGFARLNRDGTLDPSFQPQTPTAFPPICLAVQADGRILVGMRFGFLRRLYADGTSDPSFTAGVLEDVEEQIRDSDDYTAVRGILAHPDGKILVWGVFTKVNGLPRTHLARLHPDGSLDAGFNPVLTGDEYLHVSKAAWDPAGRVLALGDIGRVNGQVAGNFVRLSSDGEFDASFRDASHAASWGDHGFDVEDFAIQPDGKTIVSGDFAGTSGGIYYRDLARLNIDGFVDPEFVPEVPSDPKPVVLQPDGKLLIAIGHSLLRLNGCGSVDTHFSTVVSGPGQNAGIYQVALQPDGKVLISGQFAAVNGVGRNGFARLLGQPAHEVTIGPLSMSGGQPGFDIRCVSPRTVLVEASTNLVHWEYLDSLPVGASPVRFSDLSPLAFPSRYYRVGWAP